VGNISSSQTTDSAGQSAPPLDATAQAMTFTKGGSATTYKPKQKSSRHRRLLLLVILCCCLGLSVLATSTTGIPLYQNYNAQYHHDMALAQNGVEHLQTAERLLKNLTQDSFDVNRITEARQEFVESSGAFGQLKNDLDRLPAVTTLVPKYGNMLSAAMHIVPLAIEISRAGLIGCDTLTLVISSLHNPLDATAKGITMQDLAMVKQGVAQVQALLNTAVDQVNHLKPADLLVDPRIKVTITAFHTLLPIFKEGFQNIQTVLSLAPTLLGIGKPTSYLIELLDSTELRPGGGFIGNYGEATISNGKLSTINLTDTYLLDNAFTYSGHNIPFPSAYNWFPLAPSWSLRDSDLDADFPTSARYAEQIYHTEGGTNPVQGVIAITPGFIQGVLKITGPIYVDEYHETITAQNLINTIHYHQLNEQWNGGDVPSPDGHSSLRKRFTELLFEDLFAHLRQIAPADIPRFASLLLSSLHTKDLQLYFNSNAAEELLQRYQLASAIQDPSGDSLFVVDANIIANKANGFMSYTLRDQVTIDSSGNAIHHTQLIYSWPFSQESLQNNYGGIKDTYRDYVRIYAPSDSVLMAQSGWVSQGNGEAFGRKVWSGIFTLSYGQTGTISLTWTVHNAATQDSKSWHYHYLLQRQAGIVWHLDLQITLPSGSNITSKPIQLEMSQGNSTALIQNLTTDLAVGVDYSSQDRSVLRDI
jgi:hypothetical protein